MHHHEMMTSHSSCYRLNDHVIQRVSQPYYVDEADFWRACEQKQLLVIDRYLSTGGDVNARDLVSHRRSAHFIGCDELKHSSRAWFVAAG